MAATIKTLLGELGSHLQVGPLGALPPPVLGGAAVALGVGVSAKVIQGTAGALQARGRRAENERKRVAKRERCRRSIEDLEARLRKNPMSEEEVVRITTLSLEDLVKQLKGGSLTPLQALRAYQTKALAAHTRTNCLIEVVVEAERWAEELAAGPKEGLLYGVPISVKEDMAIKGYDNTMGVSCRIDKPCSDDAAVLKILKRHGAIPFVRTNIPQLCMSFEPGNPIFGTVLNPRNLKHGPGGSSSGEAAIVASGASPLGFGSDSAGSVRVPGHFTGVCAFKPSSHRMSSVGCYEDYSCYQQNELYPTFGPLTPEVDNMVLGLRALWDGSYPSLSDLDPTSLPLTFNEEVYRSSRKLRIGYYTEDGEFPLFPGCTRAVMEAKALLEEMGHEVVPWRVPDMGKAREMVFGINIADGGKMAHEKLKDDAVDPNIAMLIGDGPSFPWLRRLVASVIRPLMPGYADMVKAVHKPMDLPSFYMLTHQLRAYVVEVTTSWQQAGLDAVLCPPFALPSPPLGHADICLHSGAYTMAYNSLDMPSGVVPFTEVSQADINNLCDYPTDTPLLARAKEAMSQTLGLPIGVMVVGPRYKDEVCLRLMKEIEDALRNKKTAK